MQVDHPLLSYVVGGIGVTLDGDFTMPAEQRRRLLARSDEPAEIMLRLVGARAAGPLRPAGPAAAEQEGWVAFVDGDTVKICVKDAMHTPVEAMRVELARDGLDGRYLYDHDWPYLFQYPIDQLLVIHTLGVSGGALMHAASIAGKEGALVVAGPSGAGKTTMSRAAATLGARVLSDERTIVRPSASSGGWLAGGTPWPGDGGFAENRSVPLRALILLEQSDRDELVPLSPARALALLYRCHFPPVWDATACERTLGHLERLVRELPAFLYRNRKGPESARILLDQVGGAA
jgi:hypothetical protein